MRNVLVTGANGFIGSHIAHLMKERGFNVVGWDINPNAEKNVYRVNMVCDEITRYMESIKPDIIIHCAGMANVGESIRHPLLDFEANVTATYHLLEAVRESALQKTRVIFLSSAGVYGQPKDLPIRENQSLTPLSPYALHKQIAEETCLYYRKQHHVDIKIARIFSAYGPGLKKQLFWDMNTKAEQFQSLEMFGTGKESRDFIYIDDLTEALYLIATCTKCNEVIFNVANGKEITIRHAAEIFSHFKKVNSIEFNGITREGDPLNWRADISRLEKLGYEQKVSFEEGVKKYIDWIQET